MSSCQGKPVDPKPSSPSTCRVLGNSYTTASTNNNNNASNKDTNTNITNTADTQSRAQARHPATTTSSAPSASAAATSGSVAASASAAPTPSELVCEWEHCEETCDTPEKLYDHVCERHVGRKSTNNLNLTCHWGNCQVSTVKRDHITSHIRVHVPLKPHHCDFCGKAFKRPQDLKKHVKTHADESVLLKSPEPNGGSRSMMYNMSGRAVPGYYDAAFQTQSHSGYAPPPPPQHAPTYYQQSSQSQQGGYGGTVIYPMNPQSNPGNQASYDVQKRGLDALDTLYGDYKRQKFDPNSYPAFSQRLVTLHNLPLPVSNATMSYGQQPAIATMVAVGGHGPYQHYALPPMSNIRTKADLHEIEQVIDQMSQAAYETSQSAVSSLAALPAAHYGMNGTAYRTTAYTHGAPTQSSRSSAETSVPGTSDSASTPAMSPPSSAHSHVSSHSPQSVGSGTAVVGHAHATGLYPTLPTSTHDGDYAAAHSTPGAALGPAYSADHNHSYSGSTLQKVHGGDDDRMDVVEQSPKPRPRSRSSLKISNCLIDPAIVADDRHSDTHSEGRPSSSRSDDRGDNDADWLRNVRILDFLKGIVKEQIGLLSEGERPDGDEDEDEEMTDAERPKTESRHRDSSVGLYPSLPKMISGAAV